MSDLPMMRAVLVDTFGAWNNTRIGEIPRPAVGHDQVLIKSEASALNFPDLLMMEGKYQVKPRLPFVPGRDVAGTIVAVGDSVTELKVGDRVAAQPHFGAFAEYVAAPDWTCVKIPDNVNFTDAAASGTVLATVVGAMKLRARLAPGDMLLLTGAAGGVGSVGIQYARHLGAEVVALVSSDEKERICRKLGASHVLRTDQLDSSPSALKAALDAAGIGYVDAVVDVVGGDTFHAALRCLKPGGRYVIVGFASGTIPQIPANYVLVKDLVILGSTLDRLFKTRDPELVEGLREAFDALGAGKIRTQIDQVLPYSRLTEGASRIAERRAIGKIVFQGF